MTSDASRSATSRSVNADWLRALQRTASITTDSTRTLAAALADNAERHGSRCALAGVWESLTYAALNHRANAYARWAVAQGIEKGDRVALLLENEPDFVAIWIGLSGIGVVVALLNTQLVGAGLEHCLRVADAEHLIVGAALIDRVEGLAVGGRIWCHGADHPRHARIDGNTVASNDVPVREVRLRDPALLIYTSGTTGLPKAARVSHFRIMMWAEWFAAIMDATVEDRLYNCLPMYHSVGGVVAVGAMLVSGGSVIVRTGFSASRFWLDVAESGATIFQYIGELCRYLLAAPPDETRSVQTLRLCIGNGLRADVWRAFADRFEIPRIIEFYAATEGTFSLFNLEGEVGSIGRFPRFLAMTTSAVIVRYDEATGRPHRDGSGRGCLCEAGEVGEALGRIAGGSNALAITFEGYTDPCASESKIVRDLLEPGDVWYRTGDLMRRDKAGFFYFVDRVGDTFRWKGENVATSEVEAALTSVRGIEDAVVYGVAVPGEEGRAGMAALLVTDAFDLDAFSESLGVRLPRYAQPVFLRLVESFAVTGTFKVQKGALVAQGFDPAQCGALLYINTNGRYRPLDRTRYEEILAGNARF